MAKGLQGTKWGGSVKRLSSHSLNEGKVRLRENENLRQFFKRKLDKGKSNLFQAALKYIPESFYLIFGEEAFIKGIIFH